MPQKSKYYYKKYNNSLFFSHETTLIKWNERYYLELDENVEYEQFLSLEISKISQDFSPKPKSNKHFKVKPVVKEVFLDHYNLALKIIKDKNN